MERIKSVYEIEASQAILPGDVLALRGLEYLIERAHEDKPDADLVFVSFRECGDENIQRGEN